MMRGYPYPGELRPVAHHEPCKRGTRPPVFTLYRPAPLFVRFLILTSQHYADFIVENLQLGARTGNGGRDVKSARLADSGPKGGNGVVKTRSP